MDERMGTNDELKEKNKAIAQLNDQIHHMKGVIDLKDEEIRRKTEALRELRSTYEAQVWKL